jgi:hypothetical protein
MRSLDPMICTPRKSKSLMIWTTLAPKLTPFGTSGCNANHSNAGHQARREAGTMQERTLSAVACMPSFGPALAGKAQNISHFEPPMMFQPPPQGITVRIGTSVLLPSRTLRTDANVLACLGGPPSQG